MAVSQALLADKGAFRDQEEATAWLRQVYPLAIENYSIWQRSAHRAGDAGLSRYFDYGGNDPGVSSSAYFQEVIRFVLAHPGENDGYLDLQGFAGCRDCSWTAFTSGEASSAARRWAWLR
jgi:alpha,alpha-trehalase